ncbi:hypothetical protein V495_03137 [Pseudogymnoascus sp. VKM F-4514 (FW-929)]|nr:hypothetical protein V495_03137 [Pseudogymnoascus sp. VKM F-4514 (FW-929)]KFY57661.1 hypothetical protein V497_05383 [Pseudogymnoascus sp. VKM F-4516 (FW-969)]
MPESPPSPEALPELGWPEEMSESAWDEMMKPPSPHAFPNRSELLSPSALAGPASMAFASGPSRPAFSNRKLTKEVNGVEEFKNPDRLVIAIAGPTSSGKTTLSKLLLHVFGNGGVEIGTGFTSTIIHEDDYFTPNNVPAKAHPQAEWVEFYIEEWMGERLVGRILMRMGCTVDEADRIGPVEEQLIIDEYRAVHERKYNAPQYDREQLYLQMRKGKDRDTRGVIDFLMFDMAVARGKASVLNSDLPKKERDRVKNYRYLLKKPRIEVPEVEVKEEESETSIDSIPLAENEESIDSDETESDEELVHLPRLPATNTRRGELTWQQRHRYGIFRPYIADPTVKVLPKMKGKPGFIKGRRVPNSFPPHHIFDRPNDFPPNPELPKGYRKLLPLISTLRAEVHYWMDSILKLNGAVGFPGLNFIEGKFRGILFIEGFNILEPENGDPTREPFEHDLSLFLSATREGTRERRFKRPEYNKPLMKGYMTWRERSYFDGVAWPAFVDEHKWIFNVAPEEAKDGLIPDETYGNLSDLAYERGIKVRPADLGVEDTLRWAVGTMMREFERKEKKAREKWVHDKNIEKLKNAENRKKSVGDENVVWDDHWWMDYLLSESSGSERAVSEDAGSDHATLMDEEDLEVMFEVESDRVLVTEAADESGTNPNDELVPDYWGRHGNLADYAPYQDDFDPWWELRMNGDSEHEDEGEDEMKDDDDVKDEHKVKDEYEDDL